MIGPAIASATRAGRHESRDRDRTVLSAQVRSHAGALTALLLVSLLYVAALAFLPPQALTHHDEGAKYLQVRNLRLTTSGLDWSINYPARRLDPGLRFVPFHPKQHYVDSQGRIYLQWPIFLGLLTRVFWKVLGFWGLYVVPLLAGLGTLWLTYLLALALGLARRVAWLVVPLLGLCTPLPLYSLLYFEHTLASLLVAGSLLAGIRALGSAQSSNTNENETRPWSAAISGLLLALAVYFRSELYVLALVLGLAYVAAARKRGQWRLPFAWGAAFVVSLVPLWGFYAISEGTLLPVHALWYFAGGDPTGGSGGIPKPGLSLPPLRYIATAKWAVVPAFLFGPQDVPLSPPFPVFVQALGLLGAGLCFAGALLRLMRSSASRLALPLFVAGLALLLTACAATLLSGQAYYNLHGFLLAAPFVALALWPPFSRPVGGARSLVFLYAVTMFYIALHALIISSLSGLGPISLHEWGQRYLLPAYPLMAVLALHSGGRLLSDIRDSSVGMRTAAVRAGLALLCGLALVGAGFTARGYAVMREERAQVAGWEALVHSLPAQEPLVTDTWWLPLNLASEFYARPIMLAQGDSRLQEWASLMEERGVKTFALATNSRATLSAPWTAASADVRRLGAPTELNGIWVQQYSLGR